MKGLAVAACIEIVLRKQAPTDDLLNILLDFEQLLIFLKRVTANQSVTPKLINLFFPIQAAYTGYTKYTNYN